MHVKSGAALGAPLVEAHAVKLLVNAMTAIALATVRAALHVLGGVAPYLQIERQSSLALDNFQNIVSGEQTPRSSSVFNRLQRLQVVFQHAIRNIPMLLESAPPKLNPEAIRSNFTLRHNQFCKYFSS